MNDLLNLPMKAHGGLERCKQVRNMQAKVTLNGTLWCATDSVLSHSKQLKRGEYEQGR